MPESLGRTRGAIATLREAGSPVRLVRSVFVPEEEALLLVIDAPSYEAVVDLGQRAGITVASVSHTLLGGDTLDACGPERAEQR